jgi:hypothetical protein
MDGRRRSLRSFSPSPLNASTLADMYCFTRWKRSARGAAPDLPKGRSFSVLTDSGRHSEWCLVFLSTGVGALPTQVEPVPPMLRSLLESGRSFPPAISEFMVRVLRRNLRRQSSAGYVLAEVFLHLRRPGDLRQDPDHSPTQRGCTAERQHVRPTSMSYDFLIGGAASAQPNKSLGGRARAVRPYCGVTWRHSP